MSNWLDFAGRLEGKAWLLFFIPAVLGFVYYTYLKTDPGTSARRRLFLIGLRGSTLLLLLVLLAEPVLDLWRKEVVPPMLLVLVDTSASMAIEEDGKTRLEQVKQVLQDVEFQRRLGGTKIVAQRFAEKAYALDLDTLAKVRPEGPATDIARALKQSLEQVADRRQLQSILLLSDGRHNLGTEPLLVAEEIGIPVFALGTGKAEDPPDIQIVQANAPDIGYIDQPLKIEVQVRNWGQTTREIELQLFEGEQELARKKVLLPGAGQIKRVEFLLPPAKAGPHIYRLLVPPGEQEFIRDNNEALVFTRVLEERLRVLLLAGGPSPDLAFLQRSLLADTNIVVETRVHKKEGMFYRGILPDAGAWAKQDVTILLDIGEVLEKSAAEILQQQVKAGGGLLFIGGPRTIQAWPEEGASRLLLDEVLESSGPFVAQEMALRLGPEGWRHPVIRSQGDNADGGDPWTQLPPLPGYFPIGRRKPGVLTLVEGQDEARSPLVVAGAYGKGKAIAVLSTAFWKLDLQSSGVDGNPQVIRRFWRNAVKWLALQTTQGQVRVSTDQFIYRAGEEVAFAAQVFDELYRPLSKAIVQIGLEQDNRTIQLLNRGSGYYRGQWTQLPPGDYTYKAMAEAEGDLIGEDEGRFIIEQYSVESADMRVDQRLLKEIAHDSGGSYASLESWQDLLQVLPLQQNLVEDVDSIALWDQAWLVAVLVVLLGAEWTMRRRSGMI
ncbi:MAG: hypothetical protein GKR89_22990 [Candidatus Latescibacteria bacterium]|nr:hypothetical protein [Candidatus Latescibacterota bacterium]